METSDYVVNEAVKYLTERTVNESVYDILLPNGMSVSIYKADMQWHELGFINRYLYGSDVCPHHKSEKFAGGKYLCIFYDRWSVRLIKLDKYPLSIFRVYINK